MKIRINSLNDTKTKALLITTLTLIPAIISLAFLNLGAAQTADFTITAIPATITVAAPGSGTSSIIVTAVNGFTGTVSLTVTVPAGLSCSITPTTFTFSSGGATTLTATI